MDGSELMVHGGSNALSVALGWAVSKLISWRKEEREEDAKKVKEKADLDEMQRLRDRVLRLEERQDNHTEQISRVLSAIEQIRDSMQTIRDNLIVR